LACLLFAIHWAIYFDTGFLLRGKIREIRIRPGTSRRF
jgi:hypothetical protein